MTPTDPNATPLTPEILDTLVCEIGQRPAGASTITEILPAIRSARRDADALTVTFAKEASETVRAVAAAERRCCSTITWAVSADQTGDTVILRIGATPGQLDALEAIFAPPQPAP